MDFREFLKRYKVPGISWPSREQQHVVSTSHTLLHMSCLAFMLLPFQSTGRGSPLRGILSNAGGPALSPTFDCTKGFGELGQDDCNVFTLFDKHEFRFVLLSVLGKPSFQHSCLEGRELQLCLWSQPLTLWPFMLWETSLIQGQMDRLSGFRVRPVRFPGRLRTFRYQRPW